MVVAGALHAKRRSLDENVGGLHGAAGVLRRIFAAGGLHGSARGKRLGYIAGLVHRAVEDRKLADAAIGKLGGKNAADAAGAEHDYFLALEIHVVVVKRADDALAIQTVALDAAVLAKAERIHGAEHAGGLVHVVNILDDVLLVGGGEDAAGGIHKLDGGQKLRQLALLDLYRVGHCVDAKGGKDLVVKIRGGGAADGAADQWDVPGLVGIHFQKIHK